MLSVACGRGACKEEQLLTGWLLMHMLHRGMAPDAKLAFVDLANSQSGGIIMPQDLASRYYPYAYAVRSLRLRIALNINSPLISSYA